MDVHAKNKNLYAIDVAVFGKEKAFTYVQNKNSEGTWVNMMFEPLFINTPEQYRRDPEAPPQPSLDWHQAPDWANYKFTYPDGSHNWRIRINTFDAFDPHKEPRPPKEWFDLTYPDYVAQREGDGWIAWHGGELPVNENVPVDVIFRKDTRLLKHNAGGWLWENNGEQSDIVAYRVSETNKTVDSDSHVLSSWYDGSPDNDVLTGAAKLRAIAEAMDAGEEPNVFECRESVYEAYSIAESWLEVFCSNLVRRKPSLPTMCYLIDGNGVRHDFPAPMTEAPDNGTTYFVVFGPTRHWESVFSDNEYINKGLAHINQDARDAHEAALIAASKAHQTKT